MKLSRKSKIAVVLLMFVSSACFSQKWKSIAKGIEVRVGGKTALSHQASLATALAVKVQTAQVLALCLCLAAAENILI